ncbi:MAG: SCP2 sterol-binding domain-containing protein [Dehalococcoidia bacterium]
MRSTKEIQVACYAAALQRCLDAFSQLDNDDWQCRISKIPWSAKDYLGHLVTNQELEILPMTSQNIASKPVEIPGLVKRTDLNEFNERCVNSVRDLSPQELLPRFQTAFQAHIDTLKDLSEEDLQRPAYTPSVGRSGTLAHMFSIGFLHLPLHYQDIRRIVRQRRRLPHWMEISPPAEVHEALSQTFDLMPLFYWPERGGSLRATYLFDLEGDGGGQWTLTIAEGQCTSQEGRPAKADAEFHIKPAHWLDLQTKDLNPLWATLTRRLRIKGLRLALRMEKLFQIS